MREELTFAELQVVNRARCEASYHRLDEWSATDWACALGGECGEALNLVKKIRRLCDGADKPYNQGVEYVSLVKAVGEELADVVIYADLLASRLGLCLGDCVAEKFNSTSVKVGSDKRISGPGDGEDL